MVISTRQHSEKAAAQQGAEAAIPEPTKIGACTPYDFHSKNLTAYGGLLPVATMLEQLEFQRLLEQTLTVKRGTRSMTMYQFVLAMVLALYVGFGERVRRGAAVGTDDLRPGRLWFLLLGSGGSLRKPGLSVRPIGSQDRTVGGRVEGSRLEGLAAYRRGWTV